MLFRKPRTIENLVSPVAVANGAPLDALASVSLIDMLPIPAAVVVVEAGGLAFLAANRGFRQAGLAGIADGSPVLRLLGARIAGFLASDETQRNFDWQIGDSIDARHYHVQLARRPGSVERCLLTLIDQTGAARTETSLRREMLSDSLTGLPNRAGFGDLIDDQPSAGGVAVLIVNLDRFSRVNACLGSLAGDELLISVARRMKGALRGRDTLARLGGDEFGVLVHVEDGIADARHVAQRIQSALATPFRLSDFEIRVDCSIGIALGDEDSCESVDLVRNAQVAVKQSKRSGNVELHSRSSFDVVRTKFSIETQLRRALERDEMQLAFQPICDLGTGRLVAFEALARWSVISPSEFIPVAEESGLIMPLGRWAMDRAARTLAEWDLASGGDCGARLSVNLSAIQLQRDNIPLMVENALAAHGIDGRRLTLELTESAIISDPDGIAATLHALKALGASLAMDDFGTGYSNLAYLQQLPLDILKIDRSFVSGMLADRDKVAIVRAVLSLAQALGMSTTAEGVETNELSQTLAALGCTFGQGYLFGRPVAADEAYAMLAIA